MQPAGGLEQEIRMLVAGLAAEQGLELVELRLRRTKNRWHVRVDIDRAGPRGVGLGECQQVSEALGEALEDRDLIPASYVLEVSSPGLDRPIVTPDDYRRNAGRRIVIETHEPVEGRREFRGLLIGREGEVVRLREQDGAEVELRVGQVRRARQEVGF